MTVDVDDPNLVAKVDAGWWRTAKEFGLLDEHRQFFLRVDYRDSGRRSPILAGSGSS